MRLIDYFRRKVSYGQLVFLNTLGAVGCLLVGNRDWALTPAGYIDPWVYINYFRDFGNLAGDAYSDNYKATRIPWILIGNIGMNVLGIELFQLLLPVVYLVILGGLGYLILRDVGISHAIVVATSLAFLPIFHGSGAWLYHNSVTGPLQMASLLALARLTTSSTDEVSHSQSSVRRWLLVGALSALLVVTNPVQSLVLIPYIAFSLLMTLGTQRSQDGGGLKTLALRVAALVVGGLCGVLSCSLVSVVGDSRFDFWVPMQHQLTEMVTTRYDTRWHQNWSSGWIWSASWLALPTFGAALALVRLASLAFIRRSRISNLALFLNVGHLGASAIWITLYFVFQIHVLNWNYHAFPLTLTAVLAIVGGVRSAETGPVPKWAVGVAIWLPALGLAIPVFQIRLDLQEFGSALGGTFVTSTLLLACVYGAIVTTSRWLSLKTCKMLVLGTVAIVMLISAQGRKSYSLFEDCRAGEIGNKAVLEIFEQFEQNSSVVYLFAPKRQSPGAASPCAVSPEFLEFSLSALSPFAPISWLDLESVPKGYDSKVLIVHTPGTKLTDALKSIKYSSLLSKPRCEQQMVKVKGLEILCLQIGS